MNMRTINLVDQFKNKKVLVIGDFILDRYLDSTCTRLAPEASIPILDIKSETSCLGGSANVALNLHNLGAQVCYITVLGQDEPAKKAIELLQVHGIKSLYIHFTEKSSTLTKTRLCKDNQLLYRLDNGSKMLFDDSTNA